MPVILRTLQKIRPVLEPGPMRDQVSRVLPGPDAARFRAIVDEYWAAVIKEGLRDARARGKKDARWQVDLGERLKHLGEEIARSYERQVASGTLFVDYFMSELHLSPEQTRIINDLKLDMLRQSGMRPGEKDQQRLVLGALAYLTADQRAKVIKRLTGK